MHTLIGKVTLGLERGCAPLPRGRDGLTIRVILHISAREYSVDVGSTTRPGDQVSLVVGRELADEEVGVGYVPDRNEKSADGQCAALAGDGG